MTFDKMKVTRLELANARESIVTWGRRDRGCPATWNNCSQDEAAGDVWLKWCVESVRKVNLSSWGGGGGIQIKTLACVPQLIFTQTAPAHSLALTL